MGTDHTQDPADDIAELGLVSTSTSEALRALSHEHRLMILSLLRDTERSVGELEVLLRLPQPAVSQQLARLRLDDLVISRRVGRAIYYTTNAARVTSIFNSLGHVLGIPGFAASGTEARGDRLRGLEDDGDVVLLAKTA